MRKFAVILVGTPNKLAIEIVSNEGLKHNDGKDFNSEKEYLDDVYGEGNIVAYAEIGSDDKPAEIDCYKEGVNVLNPKKEDFENDIKLVYW